MTRVYRSSIAGMVVAAPASISTEAGSHIVHTVGHAGTLRIRLAAQPQVPHGFYNSPPTTKPKLRQNPKQTLENPSGKKMKRSHNEIGEGSNSNWNKYTFEAGLAAGRDMAPFGLMYRIRPISRGAPAVQLH